MSIALDALRELVELKDLKTEIDRLKQRRAIVFRRDDELLARYHKLLEDYNRRKPLAWAKARSVVEMLK